MIKEPHQLYCICWSTSESAPAHYKLIKVRNLVNYAAIIICITEISVCYPWLTKSYCFWQQKCIYILAVNFKTRNGKRHTGFLIYYIRSLSFQWSGRNSWSTPENPRRNSLVNVLGPFSSSVSCFSIKLSLILLLVISILISPKPINASQLSSFQYKTLDRKVWSTHQLFLIQYLYANLPLACRNKYDFWLYNYQLTELRAMLSSVTGPTEYQKNPLTML